MRRSLLHDFLKKQNLMAVSTYDGSIWIATVFYAIDNDFNLYFISNPKRIHSKALENNPYIACAIYDSHQRVTNKKIGVQVYGEAKIIKGLETLKIAVTLWSKINKGVEKVINLKNIKTNQIKSRFYKIKPTKMRFFNEEVYGEKEYEDFEF